MGSVVRGCRNERYIEEFGRDIVNELPFELDESLKVTGVYLEAVEGDERVWSVVQVENAAGEHYELRFQCVFDPEDDGEEDTIERLSGYIEIDEDEARKRLKRAKLF